MRTIKIRFGSLLVAWIVFSCLGSCAPAFAQETNPTLPPDILGAQLIAWSEMQKPRPVRQSFETILPIQSQRPDSNSQQSQTQAFVGTIVKEGTEYFLEISAGDRYQIGDREQVRAYEGKQVTVAGCIDMKTKVLDVVSIVLSS